MRMPKLKLSPWRRHVVKWKDCKRCSLCEQRNKVVLARGKIPCDILFIGEAPGASEDVLGKPFIGPAGKLLDAIIQSGLREDLTFAMTNLVACIPKGDDGNKIGEPEKENIKACMPRLEEFVSICKPQAVVAVGKLSQKHTRCAFGCSQSIIGMIHPAAILRMDVSQKGLGIQRCVVALQDLSEIFE